MDLPLFFCFQIQVSNYTDDYRLGFFFSHKGKCGEGQNSEFSVLTLIPLCSLGIDERCWHMFLEAFLLALCFEPGLTGHIKSPSQGPCSS